MAVQDHPKWPQWSEAFDNLQRTRAFRDEVIKRHGPDVSLSKMATQKLVEAQALYDRISDELE